MNRHIFSLCCSLLLVSSSILSLSAQDMRTVPAFEAISAAGDVEVILQPGTEEKVEIHAQGIEEDQVDVFVRRNTLKIQLINLTKAFRDKEVKVYVTYRQLYGVRSSAGARVYGEAPITADRFSARAITGGQLVLEVNAQSLEAHASEGGILELSGSTDTLEANVSTGGEFDGHDLEANRTYARASTGGTTIVVASESLEASANTGGVIRYRGQPQEKSTRTFLSGEIRKYDNAN